MRFLVVGASGFVGKALCSELIRQGRICRAAVRNKNSKIECSEIAQVGSINNETRWNEALRGVDVIVHLAARVHIMHDKAADPLEEFRNINVRATEHLARSAAASGVKRLVYVSSIKVNGEATFDGNKFSEADAPLPQDPYGISKWEAEQALHRIAQETRLEVVIVRPTLVYGAGVKGNFMQMLKVLAMGVPLPLASVRNLRSLIYVGNLAGALIICATHPAAAGQTYLVSDGEDISTSDLLSQLGVGIGHPARLLSCPAGMLKLVAKMVGKSQQVERLLGSLRIDSGKIRHELNWTPPYTLQQGLRETAEWYRNAHL